MTGKPLVLNEVLEREALLQLLARLGSDRDLEASFLAAPADILDREIGLDAHTQRISEANSVFMARLNTADGREDLRELAGRRSTTAEGRNIEETPNTGVRVDPFTYNVNVNVNVSTVTVTTTTTGGVSCRPAGIDPMGIRLTAARTRGAEQPQA